MTEDKIFETFCNLFRGNDTFFVKHQAPFVEKEGKLKASWCGFAVYNKYNPPPEGKENGDLIPVTEELYREHLNGGDGLALAPVTHTGYERNVCYYAAIDIDVYGVNYTWLVNRLYSAGFKFAPFLSKSGGLHIYFFFNVTEPADRVIAALKKIVEVYGLERLYVNEKNKSKVEIFPKQATFVPGDRNANCLFLPFYNTANRSRQNMLTAEGKLVGIAKALPVIKGMVTSVREINDTLGELPYGDAPYCVQMLLLTGALAENDGRNNFLFTAAIYLKTKLKENFKDYLKKANDCLEAPLEDAEVESIYKSAVSKDWPLLGQCKKEPCASYCDKALCKERPFGVGRSKDNCVSNVEFGKIIRVCAVEPYYLWEAKAVDQEEYRQIRIDGEADLLDQKVVQRACIRYLNTVPLTVKRDVWESRINEFLRNIEDREVPKEADTTGLGRLYSLITRYLTHRQAQNGQPYMVKLGQVYHADGAYYFDTNGIMDFLRFEKFSLRGINLYDELIKYGCSEGVITYRTPKGEEKPLKCWKKPEDGELLEMGAFYEEAYGSDADIRRENGPDSGRKGGDAEDVKF
jgi:hypothetical protein